MDSIIDFALGLLNPFFLETAVDEKPTPSSPLMEIVETTNEAGETVFLEMLRTDALHRTPR